VVDDQTARGRVGCEEGKESVGERDVSEKQKREIYGCEKRETGLIWEDDVLKAWGRTLGHKRGTDPEGSAGNWHGVGKVAEECELSEEWSKDGPEGRGQDDFDGVPREGESIFHEKVLCASESESDESGGLSNMSRSPPPQDSKRCTKATWSSRHPTKWRCPNPQAFGYMYCTRHVAMDRARACQRAAVFPQVPFVSRSNKHQRSKLDEKRGAGPTVPRKKRSRLGLCEENRGQEEDEGFWSAAIARKLGKGARSGRQSKKAEFSEMLESGFGGEGRHQESYPLRSRKKRLAGKLQHSTEGTAQHPIEFPSDDEAPASVIEIPSLVARRATPQPAQNPVSKTLEASSGLATWKITSHEQVGESPDLALAGAAARSFPDRTEGNFVPSSGGCLGSGPGAELQEDAKLASFGEMKLGEEVDISGVDMQPQL
jgi:hypothetical protein